MVSGSEKWTPDTCLKNIKHVQIQKNCSPKSLIWDELDVPATRYCAKKISNFSVLDVRRAFQREVLTAKGLRFDGLRLREMHTRHMSQKIKLVQIQRDRSPNSLILDFPATRYFTNKSQHCPFWTSEEPFNEKC